MKHARKKLVAGAAGALAVVGGGAAIAATQLTPGEESKAVVADAAKQLGVSPDKLSDALKQALQNRVDQALADGKITKEQADAMKQRIQSDEFPLFAGPGMRGPGGHFGGPRGGHHGPFAGLDAAATYLGVAEASLRESLRNGKTLAAVAKEKGKSVDGLVAALVAAETKKLDAAVAAGRLTKAQRDQIAAALEERTKAFVQGERPPFGGPRGLRGGPGAWIEPEELPSSA